ncbi:MAG: 5-deoxy-glucuronate isomerase [Candidatus Nanopelagicales bacterium]|nr:5-deoxy-glucuronate isomerase [Candidatus Nanopelagicales bacterium]
MSWHRPAGALVTPKSLVSVDPLVAGWTYSGIEVFEVTEALPFTQLMEGIEGVLVPLSATDLVVMIDEVTYPMTGRIGVFDAVSDWLYVPLGSKLTVSAASGEVALCTARATHIQPAHYTKAEDVVVEVRGAGRATRQVTNIATPESFAGADKINVCEVLTPGGNWSSWPPHRHDGVTDCPTNNEEIYYFRIGKQDSAHGEPTGQGFFHVYTVDGRVDESVTIHDGDVYLVPQGYHGPTIAPPEYPMYFLNVLAGPAAERAMSFCDDPAHHWIRADWQSQELDSRCPVTSAIGKVRR